MKAKEARVGCGEARTASIEDSAIDAPPLSAHPTNSARRAVKWATTARPCPRGFIGTKQLVGGEIISAGDRGTYYVLSSEKLGGGHVKVLTSRVGKGAAYTDFTELKVDCNNRQYFELAGGSEDGEKDTPTAPLNDWSARSKWTSLVPGSSKSDLVNYICSERFGVQRP